MGSLKNEDYYTIGKAASQDKNSSDEFLLSFFEVPKYDPAWYLLAYLSSKDVENFNSARALGQRQFFPLSNLEIESIKKEHAAVRCKMKALIFVGVTCLATTFVASILLLLLNMPQH